jgi:hypothetical protein
MKILFGALSIRGLDSFLVPSDSWLLMSGFPDSRQAARAATNFIVNVRLLHSGDQVAVTGTKKAVGSQPAVEMTDINAAGTLATHFIATPDFQKELAAAKPKVQSMFKEGRTTTRSGGGKRAAKPAWKRGTRTTRNAPARRG